MSPVRASYNPSKKPSLVKRLELLTFVVLLPDEVFLINPYYLPGMASNLIFLHMYMYMYILPLHIIYIYYIYTTTYMGFRVTAA